jgi:hypothetical protein
MSTSAGNPKGRPKNKKPKLQRAYAPVAALAKLVECDEEMMRVTFTEGRVLSVPLVWFPLLRKATPEQRGRYEIGGAASAYIGRSWMKIYRLPV